MRRYLGAFGPASVRDVEAWLGGGGLGPVFEKLGSELPRFRDEGGRELYDLKDAPRPSGGHARPGTAAARVRQPVLAHDDRTRVISDEHRKGLTTKNLRVRATVLVDGRVAGFWKLEKSRGTPTMVIEPLVRLRAADRKAALAEAEALAAFVEPGAKAARRARRRLAPLAASDGHLVADVRRQAEALDDAVVVHPDHRDHVADVVVVLDPARGMAGLAREDRVVVDPALVVEALPHVLRERQVGGVVAVEVADLARPDLEGELAAAARRPR